MASQVESISRKRFRSRGIRFPLQLVPSSGTDGLAAASIHEWLLQTYMSGSPGWLKPLRRLRQRVEVKALFHKLDRSQRTAAVPDSAVEG